MLCLLAQPVLCFFDPLWSTRHIDFQVYTLKLQPRFTPSCVLQCFSYFWTNFFYDVLSNFATSFRSRTTLVVKSAHRLRDLLSTLQICKRVVHDILKKLLSICGTVITFLRDHCPICRTVVSLGVSILAPGLEPSKSDFGRLSPKWYFSITLLLATWAFRAPGAPWGVLGPQMAPQILVLGACRQSGTFLLHSH